MRAVNLNVPTAPLSQTIQIELDAAKNEVVSFAVQVTQLPADAGRRPFLLRLSRLASPGGDLLDLSGYQAFQILPMPIDVKRAGYVRHTGLPGDRTSLPRALLPMPLDQGAITLGTARDPSRPTDPDGRGGGTDQPLLFWFDVHVPAEAPPGRYGGSVEIVQGNDAVSTVPVQLDVHNFVLPDERHLVMAGNVEWDDLVRLFPDRFEAVRPARLSRTEPAYARPVQTLDQVVALAQQHRLAVNIGRLQPVVKWPAGKPPEVTWRDYDGLVAPWLSGAGFADRVPLGFWPLPAPDFLHPYDAQSRGEYLAQAVAHFDQLDWMTRSAVQIGDPGGRGGERASAEASLRYSAEAQQILSLHPRMRVMLPLHEDQLQLADAAAPMMLSAENVSRLIAAAPSLVSFPPLRRLPEDVARPALWLRADLTDAGAAGLTPYVGAGGDEYDVRLWSWLAFLRNATLIQFSGVLPRATLPAQAADPNELVWFYPGSWFGVEEPLATVQLKWLRNAQQDYEYLWLARQRGQTINGFLMARLITKPVEIQPNQPQDPTYALMCGTANPTAWREARRLLVDNILLREPGAAVDPRGDVEVNLRMLRWAQPQERPVLMGRSTQWAIDPLAGPGANWISLRLGIDIYNASDSRPDQNALQWSAAYDGAEISPKPIWIPSLATYHVRRVTMEARVDPSAGTSLIPGRQPPMELTFTNGFTREQTTLRLAIPSAVSERRDRPINIDGSLEDWSGEDAIHDGPLVRMFNRPALQAGVLQPADTDSSVYTSWSDEQLYVAFKVGGTLPPGSAPRARNFVGYQFRRAWGEDLCQLLIQPVYADNALGPVLHVVCKSNGSVWVERKVDPRTAVDPWQSFEGAEIRYQASFDNQIWRGEVAIPWTAIIDAAREFDPAGRRLRPTLLRFNFAQHKAFNGESATWAGPVDFGRDDAFTGIILLQDGDNVGMPGN